MTVSMIIITLAVGSCIYMFSVLYYRYNKNMFNSKINLNKDSINYIYSDTDSGNDGDDEFV